MLVISNIDNNEASNQPQYKTAPYISTVVTSRNFKFILTV
jgi:hypothetical protein